MASSPNGLYLPPELLRNLFEFLPQRDLASACLVSKGWCELAFRYLHRNRTIRGISGLERFTAQVVADPQNYLTSCIHSLSLQFQSELEEPPGLIDMVTSFRRFRWVIPKLKHLKYLEWHEVTYFETDLVIGILRDFAAKCPQLEALTVRCVTYHPRGRITSEYIPPLFVMNINGAPSVAKRLNEVNTIE